MQKPKDLREQLAQERLRFAAKLRAARAILNLSQTELAAKVELTQRSIYRLEQAHVDAKRATIRTLERFWDVVGISFEELPDGGFSISVAAAALPEESNVHPIQPAIDRLTTFPTRVIS
jgi:transcriptional regulator with XRE-family HTH domain